VAKAGETMGQVVQSVTRVNDIMGEIRLPLRSKAAGSSKLPAQWVNWTVPRSKTPPW
jgi:methyl-accepting chemotaxis protein